jgi:hypothetical protein
MGRFDIVLKKPLKVSSEKKTPEVKQKKLPSFTPLGEVTITDSEGNTVQGYVEDREISTAPPAITRSFNGPIEYMHHRSPLEMRLRITLLINVNHEQLNGMML